MSPTNSAERLAIDGDTGSAAPTAAGLPGTAGSPGRDGSPRPTVSPAIHAVALSKRFGDTIAVKSLSMTVERGEVFGFWAPTGRARPR